MDLDPLSIPQSGGKNVKNVLVRRSAEYLICGSGKKRLWCPPVWYTTAVVLSVVHTSTLGERCKYAPEYFMLLIKGKYFMPLIN